MTVFGGREESNPLIWLTLRVSCATITDTHVALFYMILQKLNIVVMSRTTLQPAESSLNLFKTVKYISCIIYFTKHYNSIIINLTKNTSEHTTYRQAANKSFPRNRSEWVLIFQCDAIHTEHWRRANERNPRQLPKYIHSYLLTSCLLVDPLSRVTKIRFAQIKLIMIWKISEHYNYCIYEYQL